MSETSLCVLFMPVLLKEMRCRLGMDLSAILFSIFFAERCKRLVLARFPPVLISNGAGWKVVLFLMCVNGAVALALRTLLKLDMSPLASIHSVILIIEFAHHLYCLLSEQRRLHIIRGSARCTETVPH